MYFDLIISKCRKISDRINIIFQGKGGGGGYLYMKQYLGNIERFVVKKFC